MPKLTWDEPTARWYERGVDRVVLYTPTAGAYAAGVAWNGVTGVTSSPSGAESNKQYANNIEYANILSREQFGGTIEALTFPKEFRVFDGRKSTAKGLQIGMQQRSLFGLTWRTMKGNAENDEAGYIIRCAYGLLAQPSEKGSMSINDGVELTTMSWTFTSTPVSVVGYKPTAFVEIDSTDPSVTAVGLGKVEDALYGTTTTAALLPQPLALDTLLATT